MTDVDAASGPRPSFVDPDSQHMLEATLALGDHIAAAMAGMPELAVEAAPRAVVVLGMGGSGIAGSVLQAFSSNRATVPVVTVAGYEAPAFVGPEVVVFAVSFSGETEETLEATSASLGAGAPTIAVTGGGSLAELVSDAGGSVVAIPPGIPQPRAGIGAMSAPLLLACEQLGVLGGARHELDLALAQLSARRETLQGGDGESKRVADRIGRTIPLVHGADGLGAVAARRWKTQVNENAKAPAFSGSEPEICHNEICGFGQLDDVTRQLVTLVELRMPVEHPQVARRFRLVGRYLSEVVADVVSVQGSGAGELAGFFDLVMVGDVASLHMATREGVDPGPVPLLDELKRGLRRP